MMSTRQYYTDSYTTQFEASCVELTTHEGKPAIVLDTSYFYPTSGGQPHDTGLLNKIHVVDVVVRGEDEAVLHVLDAPLDSSESISGRIDWERRFDHMQHHSGQHILSRAFEDLLGAETLSFHLSENSVTIDVNYPDIQPEDLVNIETLANKIVMENHPVRAWFPQEDELPKLHLRKIPEKAGGNIRVVDIGGFDICACGGTHVAMTGEIGLIKIVRLERVRKATRVEFCCGGRALRDYREKNDILLNLANELTTGFREVPEAFARMQNENKILAKEFKTARQRLLVFEADEMWEQARQSAPESGVVVVDHIWQDRLAGDLQGMMQQFMQKPRTIALMGIAGEKAHLVYACSEDLNYNVLPLLEASLETLGTRSGGGRPTLAQGGGFSATEQRLAEVIGMAKARALRR